MNEPTPIRPRDPDLIDTWYQASQDEPFGPQLMAVRKRQMNQDADNIANLYFFDGARSLAFHWDGNPDHVVEVSQGGDHEEFSWYFDYKTFATMLDENVVSFSHVYQNVVAEFQATCELWIKMKEDAR